LAIEMTNFLLSLILGLWLLVAVAFYAWIAGTVLCRILTELKRAVAAITRSDRDFSFPASRRRITLAVLAGFLILPAVSYAWSATPLIRCCGLVAVAAVLAAWLLARHLRD
jgi:hypothetical protein